MNPGVRLPVQLALDLRSPSSCTGEDLRYGFPLAPSSAATARGSGTTTSASPKPEPADRRDHNNPS
jgi:hypothetical protein